MRAIRVLISPQIIYALVMDRSQWKYIEVVSGVPQDAELKNMCILPETQDLVAIFTAPSLPDIPEGETIPIICPLVRYNKP